MIFWTQMFDPPYTHTHPLHMGQWQLSDLPEIGCLSWGLYSKSNHKERSFWLDLLGWFS